LGGGQVNTQGYWDEEFQREPRPGVFRVAAVGGDLTLCGDPHSNFLTQVERMVPGLEIYNFGMPAAGPSEYAAQVAGEVLQYRPDLVLVFVSVGSDIIQPTPAPTVFNSQRLCTVQLGWLWLGHQSAGLSARSSNARPYAGATTDLQGYLRQCVEQLTVCRTPLDPPMQRRWRETFRYLDQMATSCRRHATPLALVVAPGEFQVSEQLCNVLRRRGGYEPGQLDVELPQRRLSAFAHQREVALLDLLPPLRNSAQPPFCRNESRLSDEGNHVAANVLADWITTQFGSSIASSQVASHSQDTRR
jgi:hypothetical protein